MVERCCSPAPIDDRPNLGPNLRGDHLKDFTSSSSEGGNRQLALLLIKKEEADCDEYGPGYFLLKQEGAEPILVRKEPFKNSMEKVLIPSAIQTVSRSCGTQNEISTTNVPSPKTTVSCHFKMAPSSDTFTQTETKSIVTGCLALHSDPKKQKRPISAKKSTSSGLPANSTQQLSMVCVSAPTVLSSSPGQISTPIDQQAALSVPMHGSLQAAIHLDVPRSQQNIQHLTTVSQFGPKLVTPPHRPNQNLETFPSGQLPQTLVTVTDKQFTDSKPVTSLTESSTNASFSHSEIVLNPAENMTQLGNFPSPHVPATFSTDQHTVTQGQLSTSVSQILPNQVPISSIQVPVQPIHISETQASSQILVLSNNTVSTDVHSSDLQGHLHPAPHHDISLSYQPFYPLTHASLASTFNPLSPIKSSLPQSSNSQINVQPSLEHDTSHYHMLSDPLCSSSDHFFPTPENTSDLLQPLPPISFPSPNQQETSSIIRSQTSGQILQLAPLLTLKEQQAAASSHVNMSKRGSRMHVENPMSTVNNFEEHVHQYPPFSSHGSNCANESITMEMQSDDLIGNNKDIRPSLNPGPIQHYTVLSKPGINFRVLESTKEQQSFRMNMVKDLQIDNDINKQKEGCDKACQGWDVSNMNGVLPQSALNASVKKNLPKAVRKLLEKKTECSECGRILSNASSLQNHMRLHRGERPYNCLQCGKAFPSVRGLNRHVKVHAEEKGYKCDECGRSFVYQFTLTKHKLIHSGDKPFSCKVCGKKFLAKADRATHMRMHTGEKPFFCNQCGKTFKHRVALNMHMQGHRGEKRYVCPHCEKGFVDLGNFKRHKRIHTGEKPFECKECGKRFTQSAHLKKHIHTQHAVAKPK